MKPTTFNNSRYTTNIPTDPCTVTTADIKANMRNIHTTIVSHRHGIFPFFNGNPFFSEPFGSFLRSMQIRFNNFMGGGGGGGGGHATLQQIYGLSILPLSAFYWLISTLNIAICDASLLIC